ncbi:MAG: anti-sigma factor, partial [Ekhidna sp.]
MSLEEYISSGILESYVLDQLTIAERTEVEEMAKNHLEVREEIEFIELSIETIAFKSAVKPAEHLKAGILDRIQEVETEKPTVSINRNQSASLFNYAAAASIVVALGSSILAFNYWNKWKGAENRLSDLIAQNEQFAENYNTVNQQLDNLENAVAVLDDSAYTRVVMNGTDNSPDSRATIYWNKSTQDVYLSIKGLKELSEDQQYQLWAIIDGKPVDAGVFDPVNSSMLVQMKSTNTNAVAFAVTIEPRGGSENPSLATMQVIGNV